MSEAAVQSALFTTSESRGALLSTDGMYRYRLWRIWDALAPVMVWVMLNPSTADANQDDPTIRKCIGFARANHHGGIIVVNLFAYRATDPRELPRVPDPVGPENDEHIRWAVRAPTLASVVGGWGGDKFAVNRAKAVRTAIVATGRRLQCFRKSKTGQPWHPLYLPYSEPLQDL